MRHSAGIWWGRWVLRLQLGLVLALGLIPDRLSAQGYPPQVAAGKMTVAEGLEVQLVASEPLVRQPVCIEFDDRGRMWVIQYLQYPNPAGLVRTKVDRFSRTQYDKVPDPPPHGPRGVDRITILEDTNGDGVADKSHEFVDGLNLASGMAFGHGGVFVLQVPYLLFYPDKNRDDIPDGPPEVCVTGFGMDDAHSVANSLTWGPDGWLYGCQGSTVTANINGIEFQQGVWRYHHLTKQFELHCEGGGNSWGLDFDREGRLLYSTNHGGYRLLHALPGAYYWKSFGKHGALHNPYAYGYFDHAPHSGFRGGHVTVGGIVYRGDGLPAKYRDTYLNVDTLGHGVLSNTIREYGSTVKTEQGPDLLIGNDTWFAPCDLTLGPDGAIYFCDWHDARTAHPDPDADWDRSNGRIYRLATQGHPRVPPFDLQQKSTGELIGLHHTPNDWYLRRARRILAERKDPDALPGLRRLAQQREQPQLALEALWTLSQCGGFDNEIAEQWLTDASPTRRRVAVQLWGEQAPDSENLEPQIFQLLKNERDAAVLCQLACSVRGRTTPRNWELVVELINADECRHDPFFPLLVWWMYETEYFRTREPRLLSQPGREQGHNQLWMTEIVPRMIRRLANESAEDIILASHDFPAINDDSYWKNRQAFDLGLRERTAPIPEFDYNNPKITDKLMSGLKRHPEHPLELSIALQLRYHPVIEQVRKLLESAQTPASFKTQLIPQWSRVAAQEISLPLLKGFVKKNETPPAVRQASLAALQQLNPLELEADLLQAQRSATGVWRQELTQALLGRPNWAAAFLAEFVAGRLPTSELKAEHWQAIIDALTPEQRQQVVKLWGNVAPPTPEERLAEIRRFNNDLRAAAGIAAEGQKVFVQHCAVCHQLNGNGQKVGPDLTHINRQDKDYLLVQLVDPNAIIRKEFLAYTVVTTAGRTVSGLIAEQTPAQLTLVAAKGEKVSIPVADIDELRESTTSLMPENLLKQLKPQELRDLFAFLQTTPATTPASPAAEKGKQ